MKNAAFMLALFAPPALFCAFFAFPFGKDQSTELWALAKLRFMIVPRRRVWNQSGIKELVTITAPKKIEPVLTDGLSQHEVRSRLSALANTIDSRGWAVKGVNLNTYSQPNPFMPVNSDRLIDPNSIPQQVPSYDVQASDDMLDETSNPIAYQFDQMIQESTQAHRQLLMDEMNSTAAPKTAAPAAPVDYWFLNQTGSDAPSAQFVTPGSQSENRIKATADEAALAAEIKSRSSQPVASYSHMRTLKPLGSQQFPEPVDQDLPSPFDDFNPAAPAVPQKQDPASTPAPDPAILSLASNNDLNVATLAREANKVKGTHQSSQDEVVISLR
jgi:hypothetical protein